MNPHGRIDRTIEESELPIVQCDYLVLKDVAASDGLKVLGMYVQSFGHFTVVETKGATDTFAVTWGVKMLHFLDSQTSFCQCDPEPSLIRLGESEQSSEVLQDDLIRATVLSKTIRNSCRDKCRTILAALQERTRHRPTTDSALMKWIVRNAAWLLPRFRENDVQSPFHRAMGGSYRGRPMGGSYRGKLLGFGESVLAHLPEVGILHRSWLRDGNPPYGWARATSQTSIWSEMTKVLCMREVYDNSPSTAGQKKTSEQLSRHCRGRRRRLRTSHLQLNPSLFLMNHQKQMRMRKKNQQENRRKRTRCWGSLWTRKQHLERRAQTQRETHGDTRECARDD